MASKNITKAWIQYLKQAGIAADKSNPTTGKLNYLKKVTSDNVEEFLHAKTVYDQQDIESAIDKVIGSKNNQGAQDDRGSAPRIAGPDGQQKNAVANIQRPQGQQQRQQIGLDNVQVMQPGTKRFDTSGATDVESRPINQQQQNGNVRALPGPSQPSATQQQPQQPPQPNKPRTGGKVAGQVSQTPNAIRKRAARAKARGTNLTEDFQDLPTAEMSEDDVEAVFDILEKSAGEAKTDNSADSPDSTNSSAANPKDIEKIKNVIEKIMTPMQRKQLWDLLTSNQNVAESYIDKKDAKSILQQVTKDSRYSGGVSFKDLRNDWQKASYADDTDVIKEILRKRGFRQDQIDDVFSKVLGDEQDNGQDNDRSENEQEASETIIKIANYIKKNNLTDEILEFMKNGFGDEQNAQPTPKPGMFQRAKDFGKKIYKGLTTEEVKQIFTLIINENTVKDVKARGAEYSQLGRNRK